MTIEQTDEVDFVTLTDAGELILTISDHLPWDGEGQHLRLLQDKLNAYLRFVEGGELGVKFPQALGRPVVFNLVMKFDPPKQALSFINEAQAAVSMAGFELRTGMLRFN